MPKFTPTATYDDANLVLRLYDMRREERMREARAWFAANFQPATVEEFQKLCPVGSKENAYYRQVSSYWEMVASFVTTGVLSTDLFFESGRELLFTYVRVKEMLPGLRAAYKDEFVLKNLETVALDYIEWMNKRSAGSYEAFASRIKISR